MLEQVLWHRRPEAGWRHVRAEELHAVRTLYTRRSLVLWDAFTMSVRDRIMQEDADFVTAYVRDAVRVVPPASSQAVAVLAADRSSSPGVVDVDAESWRGFSSAGRASGGAEDEDEDEDEDEGEFRDDVRDEDYPGPSSTCGGWEEAVVSSRKGKGKGKGRGRGRGKGN